MSNEQVAEKKAEPRDSYEAWRATLRAALRDGSETRIAGMQHAYALGPEMGRDTVWTFPERMSLEDAQLAVEELERRYQRRPTPDRQRRRDVFRAWMLERFPEQLAAERREGDS